MPQDTAPKVLVVDDDAVAAALLEQLLRMAGFEAVTARTGEAALALMIEQRDAQCPTGAMGDAWDVAYAALFLASDEAKYITGIDLPVDGGISLTCV